MFGECDHKFWCQHHWIRNCQVEVKQSLGMPEVGMEAWPWVIYGLSTLALAQFFCFPLWPPWARQLCATTTFPYDNPALETASPVLNLLKLWAKLNLLSFQLWVLGLMSQHWGCWLMQKSIYCFKLMFFYKKRENAKHQLSKCLLK